LVVPRRPLANRCFATIESLDHAVGQRCLAIKDQCDTIRDSTFLPVVAVPATKDVISRETEAKFRSPALAAPPSLPRVRAWSCASAPQGIEHGRFVEPAT
jgi:hypothetical protein